MNKLCRRTRCFRHMALCLVASLAGPAGRDASADEPADTLMGEIESAWRARQERFRSGDFRWKQEWYYAAGTWGTNEETRVTQMREFLFDGDRCRSTRQGPEWNSETDVFDHEAYGCTVNSEGVKMLFHGRRHGGHGSGFVCARTTLLSSGTDYNRETAVLTFRPLAPNVSWFRLADFHVVSMNATVRGRDCVRLNSLSSTTGTVSDVLWLDPAQDYLPLRHDNLRRDGRPWARLDTEYTEHSELGPVPHRWQWTEFWEDRPTVREAFTCIVEEARFNVPIPDETFDLQFPAGTIVNNERTGKYGIIREDRTLRPIDYEENIAGIPWDVLMRTEPPSAARRQQATIRWTLVVIGITVLAAGAFLWRRKRTT